VGWTLLATKSNRVLPAGSVLVSSMEATGAELCYSFSTLIALSWSNTHLLHFVEAHVAMMAGKGLFSYAQQKLVDLQEQDNQHSGPQQLAPPKPRKQPEGMLSCTWNVSQQDAVVAQNKAYILGAEGDGVEVTRHLIKPFLSLERLATIEGLEQAP
jgi:hypothetical protein